MSKRRTFSSNMTTKRKGKVKDKHQAAQLLKGTIFPKCKMPKSWKEVFKKIALHVSIFFERCVVSMLKSVTTGTRRIADIAQTVDANWGSIVRLCTYQERAGPQLPSQESKVKKDKASGIWKAVVAQFICNVIQWECVPEFWGIGTSTICSTMRLHGWTMRWAVIWLETWSHKLKPETRWFPQVKVPSTAPHNEARRSWTCRDSSEEMSKTHQMLTRSELCVSIAMLHQTVGFPCPAADVIK